jgi:hypothetical protein
MLGRGGVLFAHFLRLFALHARWLDFTWHLLLALTRLDGPIFVRIGGGYSLDRGHAADCRLAERGDGRGFASRSDAIGGGVGLALEMVAWPADR